MANGTAVIGIGAAKELASVSAEARTNNILGFIFGVFVPGIFGGAKIHYKLDCEKLLRMNSHWL
jgi:hypothetical protein